MGIKNPVLFFFLLFHLPTHNLNKSKLPANPTSSTPRSPALCFATTLNATAVSTDLRQVLVVLLSKIFKPQKLFLF